MADRLVENRIRCDKVTLFTERGCRYCRNAEEMLKQYNFVPGALEVVDITQRKDVQDYLQRRTGHRTVSSRSCSSALADPLSQTAHSLASCCRGGGEGSFPTVFLLGHREKLQPAALERKFLALPALCVPSSARCRGERRLLTAAAAGAELCLAKPSHAGQEPPPSGPRTSAQ